MKRSEFLKSGGVLLFCTCGSTLLHGCKAITGNSDTPLLSENAYRVNQDTLILDLTQIPELEQEGGSVKLKLKDRDLPIIVAKTGVKEFIVLRDECTHAGRELEYFHDQSVFRCVSFGHSRFDKVGQVIKGPAKKMILKYNSLLIQDELQIILS